MATLTPEAKQLLSTTIRSLRERLLRDLLGEANGRYRLSVPLAKAGLDEAHRRRRERLEAWIEEQARAIKPAKKDEKATRERLLQQAVKQAAATLLNRVVALKHLEALGLSKPAVLIGGWNSKGFREFREFAPGLAGDDTQGYATLLGLVFDELAVDLPGLFGDVGLTALFPVPPATLREVVERFDDPILASAWTDDTTLGWVYQYWNDPEREALDAKLNARGKIEPHEIASKTQMFTERYMVEWLLHNSLGLTWLGICKKNGWAADAERVLPILDARRAEWRKKREAGEVALDALMPIEGELEEHWKYFVPQPIPADAVATAPRSIRDLRLLDPACGSGHFLVIAFDLLAALYREEARHLGASITDKEIAESILENNLFGIDIDPRATQIAAAGLYIKARLCSAEARPKRLNLVAPSLQLGRLADDDPSLAQLRKELQEEAGISPDLTRQVVKALEGVDHLGSLLKVDAAVEAAIKKAELELERSGGQGDLWGGYKAQQVKLTVGEAKASILDKLERFLATHSRSEDLGLRLGGEQLAAGVRFVRMVKEGTYDIVVGNPPYQGTSKMADAGYVASHYPKGKADLYAAFLERGLQLVREGGISALLTMRGWMFLNQFRELREHILREDDLRVLGDFDRGAFDEVPNEVLAVAAPVLRRTAHPGLPSVAVQPTPLDDKSYDRQRTRRKRAAVLAQVGRYEFDPRGFEVIEGEPIVYWWSKEFLAKYAAAPKLGAVSPGRFGLTTGDNGRFVRLWHETVLSGQQLSWRSRTSELRDREWVPFVLGGKGRAWVEPLREVCRWRGNGLEVKEKCISQYGTISKQIRNEDMYFRPGIAFAMIGVAFSGRLHRYPSVIGNMGSSVYPSGDLARTLAILNSATAKFVLGSIAPGLHFEVGDVNRLPVVPVSSPEVAVNHIDTAFSQQERTREPSMEFRRPGPTAWIYAQAWAQLAVDRPDGAPLAPYEPTYDAPTPEAFVSFAIGIHLGRFDRDGAGVLSEAPAWLEGQRDLFISVEGEDSLSSSQANVALLPAWREHAAALGFAPDEDALRTYLRKSFFEFHKKLYENRPIYFPLSSTKKSFVAYLSIHRWQADTLSVLLADRLMPTRRRLEGELDDLRTAKASGSKKGDAERRFTEVQKLLEELNDFIARVTEIADHGPPPVDDRTEKREADAKFVMNLDDGVMVNSAALWPLLDLQWKDPKKWWKELANASGKKDYDWSHLAARYFPTRVAEKCHQDPSLAVAHKCFWRLFPEKAYAWELRLQDEIRSDFTIDEPDSDPARTRFLAEHAERAAELKAAEVKRREKKLARAAEDDSDGPLFEGASEDEDAEGAGDE